MIQFSVYDTPTGRVLARGFYDERSDGATNRGVSIGVVNPASEYLLGGVKTTRPVFFNLALDKLTLLANGVDTATISGVPAGTVAKIFKDQDAFPRAVGTITDGLLVFRTDIAGSYSIVLSNFPTQDTTFMVTAS